MGRAKWDRLVARSVRSSACDNAPGHYAPSSLFLDEGRHATRDALVGHEPFDLARGGELLQIRESRFEVGDVAPERGLHLRVA